jgi:hypothetical protein
MAFIKILSGVRGGIKVPVSIDLALLVQAGTAIMFPLRARVKSAKGWSNYEYRLDVALFRYSGIGVTIKG